MRLELVFLLFSQVLSWELHRKPKDKERKFTKFLKTGDVENLPKLNRLPVLSKAKSLQVPEQSAFDPCSTSNSVCLNGGSCENRGGSFVCHCPPSHYGKKCELLADMSKCIGHKCRNGAACVSHPKTVKIVDPDLAEKYKKGKKENEPLSSAQLDKMMVEVGYECVCRPGFAGPLCEMTEEEMECQEDFCLGRGTGEWRNGTCSCDCHGNFIGERCETENPCASFECMNSGVCHPVVNKEAGTVEAVCKCPAVQFLSVEISGPQCENARLLNDNDVMNEKMPCRQNDSALDWTGAARSGISRLQNLEGTSEAIVFFDDILNHCEDERGRKCRYLLRNSVCLNGGVCEPRVVTLPPPGEISLLMPFCKCRGADSGRFCEYRRKDECDPTREEKLAGVTRESRCTDEEHGSCVAVLGEPKCDCRAGYVGEMCETYDPCADNPCWNSECIPIPSETVVETGGEQKQTYRCLCSMGDEMAGPNRCVFSGTGNCSSHSRCNEGQCVTCEHSEEDEMMQICNEQQMNDGFRCICRPGFLPPYCEKMADACVENLCENGAVCQPTSKFDYTCQCPPGTKGTLCEEVTDICLAIGNARCQSGSCFPDRSVIRGFSCDCFFGVYGRDCQFKDSGFRTWLQLIWEHYYITLPVLAVTANLIILVFLYLICSKSNKPKSKDVEKKEEKIKGKGPKPSRKSVAEKKKMQQP